MAINYYKNTPMKYFLIVLVLFIHFGTKAQDEKVRMAYQYYQAKEYEKAAVLFEELYEKTKAQVYSSYTINCLVEIKQYQQAEKLIKKLIRRQKDELQNYIEYGYLYKVQANETEAEKQYEYVLKNIPTDRNTIVRLANSFLMKREYDYALKIYQKGRKLVNYGFYIEIANVYAFQRKSQEMVDEYLDLLLEEPYQAEMVQNILQSRLSNTFDESLIDILKRTLIKRIQKDTKQLIYSEMLLWFYIQQNDFANAVIQAKALDKKLREGGMRLIELGGIAKSNQLFSEAKDAYEYVLLNEKESIYYLEAKFGLLDVFSKQVEIGQIIDKPALEKIEKLYIETVNEFSENTETIRLIKDLAHLQAFYLNKIDEAQNLLLNAIQNNKLQPNIRGACKIELGDIYLMNGQISDAILEYAQAAKINDNNEIGDKAKLKRATLAFYTGNFQWAQAQLDVLKTGTSKLIANDAFVLSILIKDNIGMDSSEIALKYYARAEMLLQQTRENEALKILDTLEKEYNTHSLIDDVFYLKARIYEKQSRLDETIYNLNQIADNYSTDLLADDAIYKLAQIYDYQLNDKKKALDFYKRIIFDFPGSIYVVDARKRFRFLRGDKDEKSEILF